MTRPTAWRARGTRRMLREHVIAAAAASVRPPAGDRFLHYGERPLRLLLIGSGIAVGYGVTSRAQSLDGAIGSRLAERTGRGVIVNNQAGPALRLEDQIMGAAMSEGFGLEHLVVWGPNYVEMTERSLTSSWRTRMRRLLAAASPSKPVVVVELPIPEGDEPVVRLGAAFTERINRAIRHAAEGRPNVHVVTPPRVRVKPIGEPLFDAEYYDAAGATIAEVATRLFAAADALARR